VGFKLAAGARATWPPRGTPEPVLSRPARGVERLADPRTDNSSSRHSPAGPERLYSMAARVPVGEATNPRDQPDAILEYLYIYIVMFYIYTLIYHIYCDADKSRGGCEMSPTKLVYNPRVAMLPAVLGVRAEDVAC